MFFQASPINKYTILAIVAWFLLTVFVWHDIDYNHHHPKFLGEGVQALLHGEDKKIFHALLAPNDFILGSSIFNLFQNICEHSAELAAFALAGFFIFKLFDPVLIMLRRGLLQPKICE